MEIQTLVMTPYQANCYLLSEGETLVIVDPGEDDPRLQEAIAGRFLTAVVCTHAHPDHVQGVSSLLRAHDVPFYLHPDGEGLLRQMAPEVEDFIPITDGQTLALGVISLQVGHFPGHSPDGVVLIDEAARIMFVGDLIFAGSIGRVDLPGSDPEAMEQSLRAFAAIEGDYTLYAGHGPPTTLAQERRSNPFLQQLV